MKFNTACGNHRILYRLLLSFSLLKKYLATGCFWFYACKCIFSGQSASLMCYTPTSSKFQFKFCLLHSMAFQFAFAFMFMYCILDSVGRHTSRSTNCGIKFEYDLTVVRVVCVLILVEHNKSLKSLSYIDPTPIIWESKISVAEKIDH